MPFPGLRSLIVLLCTALLAGAPAFAQSTNDAKPPDQQKAGDKKSDAVRWAEELAEAARMLTGPSAAAAKPECMWLGKRIINLLSRDDLDTAFRHLDLYDRFGCPGNHIQVSFSCMARQGMPDAKAADTLDARVQSCWVNPSGAAPPTTAATAPAPAPTAGTGTR
jgi:hypothetical protein